MKETEIKDNNSQSQKKSSIPKYSDKFKDLMNKAISQPSTVISPISHHQKQNNTQFYSYQNTNFQQHKHSGPILQKQYFFYRVKSIGVGAHSFVYLIQEQETKCLYAQKAISKSHAGQHKKQLQNQIKIQYKLHHDNLINLYHFYSDQNYVYLVMEYAEQSLFNLKSKFNIFKEKQVIQILRQMLHALSYMHKQGFIHADIKIENVMIRNGRIKLCDFGYAVKFEHQKQIQNQQIIGTLQYLSPEYVQGRDTGPKRDIWALGILCFQLWTGKNPFQDIKQEQKWLKLIKPDYSKFKHQIDQISVSDGRKSQKIQEFIKRTLCPDEQRYSANSLLGLDFFNSTPSIAKS